MLRDEGRFLLEWISMHFDFATFKDRPLLISHWFTDDRVVFKLELMQSAVFPDAKMVVSSANKAVWEGEVMAAGRSLIYIENRRRPSVFQNLIY